MRKAWIAAAAAYLLIGIVTFGHSAAHFRCPPQDEITACDDTATPALGGFIAGILWPLYWSWEAFS